MGYRCSSCGESHEGLPGTMQVEMPDYALGVPEAEREERVQLTSDTCIVDNEHFFVRGVIEIPVLGYPHSFGLGVWVPQKRENFPTYMENFDSAEIGPFFGWLSNEIAFYREGTLHLKTMAHFSGRGLRPTIELEETDNPLSLDQHLGITLDKAWEIVHFHMDSSTEDA